MNTFNRIVIVVLLLALMALVVGLLLAPFDLLRIGKLTLQALEDLLLYAPTFYPWYVGVLVALLVLFLVVFYLEIRKTRKRTVLIQSGSDGLAYIDVQSVVNSLAYRIDELPGVRDVRPRIISYGKNVKVIVDLHTSPTVNVPAITAQIVNLAHEIVESQLGVKIRGKVRVNVTHEPFPRGTLAPGALAPAAAETLPTSAAGPAQPVEQPPAAAVSPSTETPSEEPTVATTFDLQPEDFASAEPPSEGSENV